MAIIKSHVSRAEDHDRLPLRHGTADTRKESRKLKALQGRDAQVRSGPHDLQPHPEPIPMHPLVKLAKDTLHGLFTGKEPEMPDGYEDTQGCFVTLKKHGELRGCIGFVTSDKPLKRGVKEAAEAAAKHDPRFPAVTEDELDDISVEVSVLTKPRRAQAEEPKKKMEAFTPGETGLIIQRGWKSGLLLPQVFDEDTPAEEALAMTCKKAGLPPDAWKQPETYLYTFTATVHHE